MAQLTKLEKELLSCFTLICGRVAKHIPLQEERAQYIETLSKMCFIFDISIKDLDHAKLEADFIGSIHDLLK